MLRLTGTYNGIEYVVLDYGRGLVECPTPLLLLLANPDGTMPQGDALLAKCREVFGATLQSKEY